MWPSFHNYFSRVTYLRRGEEGSSSKVLRVFKHEEEIEMPNENPHEFRHAVAPDDHVKQA